jgi:hypothetical protein
VEAVSNTSTVTLRVVGDDEKKRLESETVKYMVASPKELGSEIHCAGEVQQQVRENASYQQTNNCQTIIMWS